MTRLFYLLLFIFLYFGCAQNNRHANFEYIKIIYSGYGHDSYCYYDPENDSLIYQVPYNDNTVAHKTMAGSLGNSPLLDTFINTIQTLKQYKNGSIPLLVDDESFYCGPTLYTEFKDERGVHFYTYTFAADDTLDQFISFYENLQQLKWNKKRVKNELVDIKQELNTANQYMLSTRNKNDFYSFLPCDSGIDATKLYGSWRSIRDSFNTKLHSYIKLTIEKNGDCFFKRIVNDTVAESHFGKVSIDTKNHSIMFIEDGKKYHYRLIQLCNNCLQYRTQDDPKTIRFDRFDEPQKTSK
jgi:hypothetical protein